MNNPQPVTTIPIQKKVKKPRCSHCNKKLKLIELTFICKCKHVFCQQHLKPHLHDCPVDYLALKRQDIHKNNPKMCIQLIEVKSN